MSYNIEIISMEERERLLEEFRPHILYDRKANIAGACIKLHTNSRRIKDAWEDNFYFMGEVVKSHGRVFAFYDDLVEQGRGAKVGERYCYEPFTRTAILRNVGYYGYVKSVALAVAGDIFEDAHSIHSIHGAALDLDGKGVSIIAPSGTGKTTHGFGLLQLPRARLVSDDWFFVRLYGDDVFATSTEKNSYIRDDLAQIWPQYQYVMTKVTLDHEGRSVADIRWIVGKGHIRESTYISTVFLFKRDPTDGTTIKKLEPLEGLELMKKWNFCNPHLLVKDGRKQRLRERFFEELFSRVKLFLVNTVPPPGETQAAIRGVLGR